MNTVLHAARLGLSRGWIETKQSWTSSQDLTYVLVVNGILLLVLFLQRNSTIEGMSLTLLTLPSLIGMSVATGGIMGAASTLSADREDGTLLRAKAIPQGMVGYLVGRMYLITFNALLGLAVVLIPGFFLVDGLADTGIDGWLQLIAIFGLGLLATLPWGAIVGSLVRSSSSGFGLTFLAVGGLTAISGIFYPITALAGWLQVVAQLFPVYWLGHGMRYSILPDSAVAAEIGGAWRPGLMLAVLAVWAVVGLLLAPRILRNMARRESGATMEARKQEVLNRGY
jgi:ABC-2 type transport system permease protein